MTRKSTRNRQKMDSECTICINFSKNFPGEPPPRTPTCRRGISTSAYIQLRVKNHPASRISERSFEDKNYTQILGKNQHAIGKKLSQNAPFASIFLKKFPGEAPRTPTCGRGIPLPSPSPCGASRRFGYAPRQWTLWIRHWRLVKKRL